MDRVEFNGNEEITMYDIYNFISEKILSNIGENSIITVKDIKEILEKIHIITKGSDNITNEQLLEVIKILLPYKLMNYFGGQVIHKHFFSDNGRNQFFKYKLINNELYLYDNALEKERQRKIKVKKINEIDVKSIIDKLNLDPNISNTQIENILMHPELLKAIGIDAKNEYNLTLLIEEKPPIKIIFSLNKISDSPNFIMFEKNYEPAKILSRENFQIKTDNEIPEDYSKRLVYSYDSCQKLLQMLLGFSKNSKDIELFNEVMKRQINYNIKSGTDEYLDWMFISSFFLFNEQKIKELSDDTYDNIIIGLGNYYNCYYLDKHNEKVAKIGDKSLREIGYNRTIINPETKEIEYHNLIRLIRNSLAHSSYEVIDESYIRCYGENFNIIADKKLVMTIISELIYNTNLDNLFPLFYMKRNQIETYYKSIENEEELKTFLKNISFISIEQTNIRKNKIDNEFKEIIARFKKNRFFSTLIGTKNIVKLTYNNSKISEFIYINFPKDGNDKEIDIKYVINEIRKYGDDFYRHSLYNQYEIIKEIIREKELSEKGISPKLFNIISTKEKTTGNIIDTIAKISPIEYINYGKYIQATFITYLNSLLVYPCSDKYHKLDCRNLLLDRKMEILLISKDGKLISKQSIRNGKLNEYRQKQRELSNAINTKEKYFKSIKDKRRLLSSQSFLNNANLKVIEKVRSELKELLEKNKDGTYEQHLDEQIKIASNNLIDAEEEIKNIDEKINNNYHQIIIEHLRNSLAHGRISFPNGFDFNNIGNTIVHFEDYDKENNKTFDAKIKLSDLILELSKEKFLASIFSMESKDKTRN